MLLKSNLRTWRALLSSDLLVSHQMTQGVLEFNAISRFQSSDDWIVEWDYVLVVKSSDDSRSFEV